MFAKTCLLVLFGAVLVSASPVAKNELVITDDSIIFEGFFDLDLIPDEKTGVSTRSFSEKWQQLKEKWSNWLESVKPEWENFKAFGQEKYESVKAKFITIKEEGEKLLEQLKEFQTTITTNGKEIYEEFKQSLDVLKGKVQKAKAVGSEAYEDIVSLLNELNNDLGDIKGKLKLALSAWKAVELIG